MNVDINRAETDGIATESVEATEITQIEQQSLSSAKISWQSATGAEGYKLYRAVAANGTYTKIYDGPLTSYVNSGLVYEKKYYYKVISYSGSETREYASKYSDVKEFAIAIPTTVASSSTDGTNQVKVSWNSVDGASGYKVYSRQRYGSYSLIATVGVDTLYYDDTNVDYGKTYYYYVTTLVDFSGTTKESLPGGISAIEVYLAAPTNLEIDNEQNNRFIISWDEVDDADGYYIYYVSDTVFDETQITKIESSNTTSYEYKGTFTPYDNYTFGVYAYVNVDGNEVEGWASEASTVVRTTALTNVSHSVGSDGVLVVSWDKYSGTLGMFGKYYVYVSNTVDGTYQKYSMSPTAYNTQSYRLGTYDSSKDYYIYVTAYACIPGYSEYFGTNYKELTCAQSPKYRILNTMTQEEQISITTAAISPISDKVYNGSAYKLAGDVNGDGKINITDFIKIKATILGKDKIVGIAAK